MLCVLMVGCSPEHDTLLSMGVMHPIHVQALSNDDFQQPPSDAAKWLPVTLPDNWDISRPDQGGGVWYRIPMDLKQDGTQNMGILLDNFSMNASIWWGQEQLVSGGSMVRPYARNWHRPLYASLAPHLLKHGHHWIYIRVHGYPNDASGLGSVFVGSEAVLQPMYAHMLFLQQTFSFLALVCSLLLAFGCLLMWFLQRSQRAFLWMACAAATWSLVISNFVLLEPMMPRFYWESLVDGAIELYSIFLMLVVYRILGERHRLLVWLLALFYTAGWLVILLFGSDRVLMGWAMPMHTMVLLFTLYLFGHCLMRWYRQGHRYALMLALAISTQLFFAVHDWWMVYFGNQLESVLIMQMGPTLTLFMVAVWMIYEFSQSLRVSKAHTAYVEAEVDRVTADLHQEHQLMEKLQKKQLLSEERERFTRELHDGLGGYLSAISAMLHDGVRDENVLTRTIDQALLEMRVVMDGIGDECNDVGMLLGMLRHRLQQPLQAWGVQVSWNITGVPMPCTLADGHAIHVMRIVQESLTNAARHAHADWIEVRAGMVKESPDHRLCIEVIDNGCGWNTPPAGGKGLANMRKRAELMDGDLQINAWPDKGVCISLTVAVNTSSD